MLYKKQKNKVWILHWLCLITRDRKVYNREKRHLMTACPSADNNIEFMMERQMNLMFKLSKNFKWCDVTVKLLLVLCLIFQLLKQISFELQIIHKKIFHLCHHFKYFIFVALLLFYFLINTICTCVRVPFLAVLRTTHLSSFWVLLLSLRRRVVYGSPLHPHRMWYKMHVLKGKNITDDDVYKMRAIIY